MNVLDILIVAVLLCGVVKGWMSGLIRQVVSTVGFLIALAVAVMFYSTLGDWLAEHYDNEVTMCRAIAFIILWAGTSVGLTLLARVVTQAIKVVQLGGLNRLGGAAICTMKYMAFISLVLNVGTSVSLIPTSTAEESRLTQPVRTLSGKMFQAVKTGATQAAEKAVETVYNEN